MFTCLRKGLKKKKTPLLRRGEKKHEEKSLLSLNAVMDFFVQILDKRGRTYNYIP